MIDTISCDTAGTQKQLLETIRRLDRNRFDPVLLCLWSSPWLQSADLPCRLHILDYSGFLKLSLPGVLHRLRRVLRLEGTELVHVFFDESMIVAWLAVQGRRDRPVLLSSRRDMGLGTGNQPWYHGLFRTVLPIVNRGYDGFLANSKLVQRYAAKRERTEIGRFKVIRNGVDLPNPEPPPLALQREHPAAVNVCIVASLTPVKRHDVLLQAWSRIRDVVEAHDARLYILGDGPGLDAAVALCDSLGIRSTVRFVGAVRDVPAWLQCMNVGVLCSDREGLSNAILEYMANGLPVVATAVGGNLELVDESNGVLVQPGDPAALASALSTLVVNPGLRREKGDASIARTRGAFSWDLALDQLYAYYDSLLANAGRLKNDSSS
ncbi:MAG: glycosyltransferase [bacterium]|nr:glycosyltransferase [bacterium]